MTNYTRNFSHAAVIAMVLMAGTALANERMQPQQATGITYVTGGVGEEELATMQAMKGQYNFYITNADQSGAYVENTNLSIMDRSGNSLVNTHSDPLFYAKLPAGSYVVEGNRNGQTIKKDVTIIEGKTSNVNMTWK